MQGGGMQGGGRGMGSTRIRTLAVATSIALGASFLGMGVRSAARAATGSPSLGTATVAMNQSVPGYTTSVTFTFSGSIAVGDGGFTGTASGTAALPDPTSGPAPNNPIPPFTLSGPGLTGTCSGLWLADPGVGSDPVGAP